MICSVFVYAMFKARVLAVTHIVRAIIRRKCRVRLIMWVSLQPWVESGIYLPARTKRWSTAIILKASGRKDSETPLTIPFFRCLESIPTARGIIVNAVSTWRVRCPGTKVYEGPDERHRTIGRSPLSIERLTTGRTCAN
jgi:hypothetical protein